MRLQPEQIAKQIEMGLDAQKRFAEVYKDGNMNKRIRIQMKSFQLIEVEEAMEEVGRGEGQSPYNKMRKDFYFIGKFERSSYQ
jgi:hypothetical protein